jgi:predicted TIM-barrel fold metal-dependent hydrolase
VAIAVRKQVLISADAHIGEAPEMRARMPLEFRDRLPILVDGSDGDLELEVAGKRLGRPARKALTAHDRLLEFRDDPSRGADLDRRRRDMAREGVDAQVVFPNVARDCGGGRAARAYATAFAHAYNGYVRDVFGADPWRFKPAAMLPTDEIEDTLAEAQRCLDAGFAALFLPCVVPWGPVPRAGGGPVWGVGGGPRGPLTVMVLGG